MSGLLVDLALAAVVALLVRRRRARCRAPARRRRAVAARRWHRSMCVALVIGIVGAWVLMPALLAAPSATSYAAGLDCKDPPAPETPGDTSTDFFDSNAEVARGDGTAYGKYGWAGLVWHTYDLGCGPDVVRAPAAVWDTQLGNAGLAIAKWTTGLAVWLDRESQTNPDGSSNASTVFGRLDGVVARGSAALRRAFYDPWIAIAVSVVGISVLYFALKGSASSAMRRSVVAGLALFLAGLAVGLPTGTTHEVDRSFNAAIGRVRDDALARIGVNPATGPREAVIEQVIVRQWKVGEFGDPDSVLATRLAGPLRDAQALTYNDVDALAQVGKFCKTYGPTICDMGYILNRLGHILGRHTDEYTHIANELKAAGPDAYGQFIGKRENRTSAGWIAALEAFVVNALWIAASLLRFVGLLIVRLAVLFAPIWAIPAMVSEQVLGRVVRFVGAALFLALVASAAVAADLVALTGVLRSSLSPGWQTFVMLLISAVIWMLLRPFKRLTQLIGMNNNATLGHAFGRGKRALTGLVGYAAGRHAGRSDEADPAAIDPTVPATLAPQPQEGARHAGTTPAALSIADPAPARTIDRAAPRPALTGAAAAPASAASTASAGALPAGARGGTPHLPEPDHPAPTARPPAVREPPAGAHLAAAGAPHAAAADHADRRVVTVDEQGRIVDVHDALYDPGGPERGAHRVHADRQLVHELYTPAQRPSAAAAAPGASGRQFRAAGAFVPAAWWEQW